MNRPGPLELSNGPRAAILENWGIRGEKEIFLSFSQDKSPDLTEVKGFMLK